MSKKIYSLIMSLVILVGSLGTIVNAKEAETSESQNVTLEEAQNKLNSLTEREKKSINGQKDELKELLVPSATKDYYFNDFAKMFTEEEKKQELIETARKIDETENIKFVIETIDNFSGVEPDDYAILVHDIYNVQDGITLVISEEQVGSYFYNDGKSFKNNDFDKKISEEIEKFSKKKNINTLIELQKSLISIFKEHVLKINTLVLDNEEIFSEEELETLKETAEEYSQETGIEISIVTSADKVSFEDLEENCNNVWFYIILYPENKNLEILITKEAEEYVTNSIAKKMCNDVKEQLNEESYGQAIISLQNSFIEHLKQFNVNSNEKTYTTVEFEF